MKFAVRTTSLLFSFLFTTVFSQYNGTAGYPNSTSTAENATIADAHFWLEDIEHQGVAAFRQDSTYQVFRNVKSFGAKGMSPPSTLETKDANLVKVTASVTTPQRLIWLSVVEDVVARDRASLQPPAQP